MSIGCVWLDCTPYENFEDYIIRSKGLHEKKTNFYGHFVDCLYSLGLKFVVSSARLKHAKTHVKLFVESLLNILCNFNLN